MNDLERIGSHIQKTISLTDEERALLRSRLEVLTRTTHTAVPTPSPYPYFAFFMKPASLFAGALVLVVVSGGGVASAAQGALPGDALYSVKIHVNEKVESALARTPSQKAYVEIEHARERLQEIQLLAAAGKDERIPIATEEASQSIALSKSRIDTLTEEDTAVADAQSDFSYTLAAHADILDAQAFERNDTAGVSMSALARVLRAEDEGLIATATRAEKMVEKARAQLDTRPLSEEARMALEGELALVQEELSRSKERSSARGYALVERHAYRVLALIDSSERIASKTGKQVRISFSEEEVPEAAAGIRATTAVQAKSAPSPEAVMLMAAPREEDKTAVFNDEDEEETPRFLKLRIVDENEVRREEEKSGKDENKDEGNDDEGKKEDRSGKGSGSGKDDDR